MKPAILTLLIITLSTFFTFSSFAGNSSTSNIMNKLDYVISYKIDETGGFIKTKNTGMLTLDWKNVSDPYLKSHPEKISSFLEEGKNNNIPVWFTYDNKTKNLSNVWFAYKAFSISPFKITGSDDILVMAMPCPSPFRLDKSTPDFTRLKNIIEENQAKDNLNIYLAAQPGSIIHDIIIK